MFATLAAAALPVLLRVLLLAQDPNVDSYVMRDQSVLTGEVQSVSGETVTIKVSMFGGTAVITRNLSDFTPGAAFLILTQQSKDTFEDHMRLAKYAAANGVEWGARKEFKAAYAMAEKAKDTAKQDEVVRTAADVVEKLYRDALTNGDLTSARKYLDILVVRLADARTPAQRSALTAMMEGADDKALAARRAAEGAREAQANAAQRAQLLKPIDAKIKEGQQYNSTGLGASGSAAKQAFDNAIQDYVAAYQQLTSLQKSNADDAALQTTISSTIVHLRAIGIQTCMNAASLLMTQTDYQGAQEYVNKVIQFDPKNEEALEMRQQIQQASSGTGNGWGWGWRPAARRR